MANDVTRGLYFAVMPYGPRWKEQSRAMTAVLNPKASQAYELFYNYSTSFCLNCSEGLSTAYNMTSH